jgi:hypothetical protein
VSTSEYVFTVIEGGLHDRTNFLVTRTRTEQTVTRTAPYPLYADGSTGPRSFDTTLSLSQETTSEGHPWYQAKKAKYRGRDIGGPFSTRRYTWDSSYKDKRFTLNAYYGGGIKYVDGNIYGVTPSAAEFTALKDAVPLVSDSVLDSWGTTAISGVIPTKSEVDLAVGAIELAREGLPAMIGQGLLKGKLKDFRKAGDELLNIEFGIKPLIGDIQGTAKAIVESAERIKQLERDSGRLVRRKFNFPDREETFATRATGVVPAGWSNSYLWQDHSKNERLTTTTFETKRWFSGAFTYYLNLGERQRSQLYAAADNARLLLGVKLDAEVLWNLAPWSWLADWFGNVGDIATNISHFSRDGLVMPYGYLMCQTSVQKRAVSTYHWKDPMGPKTVVDELGFIRKQRRPANPFGFGLTDLVLDTRQTSILAALGITRVPRK